MPKEKHGEQVREIKTIRLVYKRKRIILSNGYSLYIHHTHTFPFILLFYTRHKLYFHCNVYLIISIF
jgi:hypothetical protein